MIVTSNLNGLTSDNLLFEITECDPENSEGIKCASSDEIKNKTKYLMIYPNYLTQDIDFLSDQQEDLV